MAIHESSLAVAQALWQIGAVGYSADKPVTFKSGIISPVYVDNRRLPYHPAQWHVIIDQFAALVQHNPNPPDVIAGVETAGIPHSAALAYTLNIPSVYVRKQPKDHGTKSRIEGGDVTGKRVLLIEDMVTTGESSLAAVEALREAGAVVEGCLAIITYGFDETQRAFESANVALNTLTTFMMVVGAGREQGYLTDAQADVVLAWLRDPRSWKSA